MRIFIFRRLLGVGRLQAKVILVLLVMVVLPMLLAGFMASSWVSASFERRIQSWVQEAARSTRLLMQAQRNDALTLGRALAEDREFVDELKKGRRPEIGQPLGRIAMDMGITFLLVFDSKHRLIHSSPPVTKVVSWRPGESKTVLRVVTEGREVLALVGITPIPTEGAPDFHLALGALLDRSFLKEIGRLTGLHIRLYQQKDREFFDVDSAPGQSKPLHLSDDGIQALLSERSSFYDPEAEQGRYRGVYTPILDSDDQVVGILFGGFRRAGAQEVLTNRAALFALISAIGLLIGGAAGVLLGRFIVRPVEHVSRGIARLAGQDFTALVPARSDDELGDLARAFNAMAQRLREARDQERQEFQKNKLAAMGELSASLAHEIRNPIGVIKTSTALLAKGGLSADQRENLVRMIGQDSERINNLVEDFLRLSRPRMPSFEIIDPTSPLEQALAMVMAGHREVEIARRYGHQSAAVRADRGLLQQVWSNLIANALEAMGKDGGQIVLESEHRDGHVRLLLEDSGPGIAPDVLPRVFEPFFTTKAQGTGLGLYIAHALAEANGGTLEARPGRGAGAVFVLSLPAALEQAP